MSGTNYICPACKGSGGVNEKQYDELDVSRAELATLEARLTDALSLLHHKGHDSDCPASRCECTGVEGAWWHDKDHPKFDHKFKPGPCSDTCGLARLGVVCTT